MYMCFKICVILKKIYIFYHLIIILLQNLAMVCLQLRSIVSNLLFSADICFLMSSEAKIGSRYIHPLYTLIIKSRVSCIKIIFPSINLTYFSIFFSLAIGEAFIIISILSWSSRIYYISSTPLMV